MPIFRSDRLRSFASKESLARFATEVTLPTTPIRRVVAVLVDTVHACAVHTHNTTSGNLIIIAMIDVSVSACQQVAVVVCPNPHTHTARGQTARPVCHSNPRSFQSQSPCGHLRHRFWLDKSQITGKQGSSLWHGSLEAGWCLAGEQFCMLIFSLLVSQCVLEKQADQIDFQVHLLALTLRKTVVIVVLALSIRFLAVLLVGEIAVACGSQAILMFSSNQPVWRWRVAVVHRLSGNGARPV